MSFGRLQLASAVVVCAIATIIPSVTLCRHWRAVTVLQQGEADVDMQPPPFSDSVNQEWYEGLFGTADCIHTSSTLSVEEALHCRAVRGLTSLSFDRCADAAWPELPLNLLTLQAGLNKAGLSPAAYAHIAKMQRLETLFLRAPAWARHERHVTAELNSLVAKLPHLKALEFQNVRVPNAVLQNLLKQLPALEELQLSDEHVTDTDIELVSQHTGIRSLDLSHSDKPPPLTVACLDHLAAMKSLRHLTVDKPEPEQSNSAIPVFAEENLAKLRARRPDLTIEVFDRLDVPYRAGFIPHPDDE